MLLLYYLTVPPSLLPPSFKGNIRVYVRVRPPTHEDAAAEAKDAADHRQSGHGSSLLPPHPLSGHAPEGSDPSQVRLATTFFEDDPELIQVGLGGVGGSRTCIFPRLCTSLSS